LLLQPSPEKESLAMNVRILALSALVVCIGCSPGDITGGQGPAGADAAVGPDADPNAPDGAPAAACTPAVSGVGSGEHNAGQACIACHAGNGGPDFTLAGTLYTSSAGGTPIAGGTITVTDADGTVVEVVSQNNGNFYTLAALTFPVQVSASRCPDSAAMSSDAAGDCNAGGCHTAGGSPGRIHLP
jgi:hypothetical protein